MNTLHRRPFATLYATVVTAATVWLIVLPAFRVARELHDPAWRDATIARQVEDWHRSLSSRFAPWARDRVARSRATTVERGGVSGTEWPLFSAVLYLWTSEALQDDRRRHGLIGAPSDREAIEAAAALVADPGHAGWVRAQWGERYLDEKDLFYRMLLIAGLDSYERQGGDARYHDLLTTQVTGLAAELDASPHGVLEDYPGEAYSVDVLLAYAAIARAQRRLGTLDAAFLARARRAFEGDFVEAASGLPGYAVDARCTAGGECSALALPDPRSGSDDGGSSQRFRGDGGSTGQYASCSAWITMTAGPSASR